MKPIKFAESLDASAELLLAIRKYEVQRDILDAECRIRAASFAVYSKTGERAALHMTAEASEQYAERLRKLQRDIFRFLADRGVEKAAVMQEARELRFRALNMSDAARGDERNQLRVFSRFYLTTFIERMEGQP